MGQQFINILNFIKFIFIYHFTSLLHQCTIYIVLLDLLTLRQKADDLLQKLSHADYADDLVLLTNTSAQAESQLHNQEQIQPS